MAETKLREFWLRYTKQGWGKCVGVIRASSLMKAEQLGRAYCAQQPNRVYLTVEDPVLISEGDPLDPVHDATPPKATITG